MTKAGIGVMVWLLMAGLAVAAPAPDSKRMGRAKDFIADEQWFRAIVELQAAVADPNEANRDEARFWLAQCQHEAGDDAAALQTIATLERTAPASRWVRPARSLRIEIAQRLRRDDLLWMMVTPPPPPPAPGPATQPVPPRMRATPAPAALPPPATPPSGPVVSPTPAPPAPPSVVYVRPTPRAAPAAPPAPPLPPAFNGTEFWLPPDPASPDKTLKVQALNLLLDSHSDQVIPMLREMALDRDSPDEARQAVFVLGQSRRPEAHRTMLEVAREGAEPVRVAAVRELGRFEGPMISTELMRVYRMANTPPRLKRQVVSSLGERFDSAMLVRIVQSESEATVRDLAIVTLGRTGARDQLRQLYLQTPHTSRPAVLTALFTVKDDDELIRIASTERDPVLRARAREQLRMLATPKAAKYLEEHP